MRDYKTKEEVKEIKRKAQEIIDEWGIQDIQGKSGLYFVLLFDKVIYVGESQTDLAYRIARHKMHILDPTDEPEKKYDIMRELYQHYPNQIRVKYQTFPANDCKYLEDLYIDKYKPILNTTFPIYNYFSGKYATGHYNIKDEDFPTIEEVKWYVESGERNMDIYL